MLMRSYCGCDNSKVVEGLESCINIDQNSLDKTFLNSPERWTDSDNPFGYFFNCIAAQTEEKCNNMLDIKFNPNRPDKYNAYICRWNEGTCGKVETDNPNPNGPISYLRCSIDDNYEKCCHNEEANLNDQYPDGVPGTFANNINNNIDNLQFINNQDLSVDGPLSHITREMSIIYPEFSWLPVDVFNNRILSNYGGQDGRVFMRWGSDISRVGFDGEGKVYNLICPQLGRRLNFSSDKIENMGFPDGWDFGTFNTEVTVLNVRGFVNETKLNADGCKPFTPDGKKHYDYTDLNSELCASTEPARHAETGDIIPEVYECFGNNDGGQNMQKLESQKDTWLVDIEVIVKVWIDFTDSAKFMLNSAGFYNLPDSKQNAVKVKTYDKIHLQQWRDVTGKDFPTQKEENEWNINNRGSMLHIRIRPHLSPNFTEPEFTKHNDSCVLGNLEAVVGNVIKTNDDKRDLINELVFNIGNYILYGMLSTGNTLTWNLWANKPKNSIPSEYREHKQMWVNSIHLQSTNQDYAFRRGQTPIFNDNQDILPDAGDIPESKLSEDYIIGELIKIIVS
tara:strand:+ start:622 stop:2313 length:1692 start_codon:yes stop_codon:yes gene_type:complete